MLSLIQWEMWLGDQMLPIYPRLAGWFYFYACFKRHTILPLIRKLPIRKKKSWFISSVPRGDYRNLNVSTTKDWRGCGGAQSVKCHCESIRGWLWTPNAQIKRQGQWRVPEEEVTGQSRKPQTSQSSSTHQLQGQWQILSPKIGWRVTKSPTLAMHVHTHLSTLTQTHRHRKEKWPSFRFNHIPIQLTKKQSRNFHLSLKPSSSR